LRQRHVVLVAPPWYPVPPRGYGGIELIVHLLAGGLRERGWRVSLLAVEGSMHDAIVCAPPAWHRDLGTRRERLRELEYAARISSAVAALDAVDIVHDHVGFASLLAVCVGEFAPVVHTVHGPVGSAEADGEFLAELGHRVSLVAISDHQRSTAPALHWVATVYNAVDAARLIAVSRDQKQPYLLCLARICEEKGQHIAIEVAHRVGMQLILAGKVENTAASRHYFAERVLPYVDGDRVRHITNVRGTEKSVLLGRAHALLAPIQWDEPFGLSVVEAMVSGTPAISTRRGAAPELIQEGVTGFLVDDLEGMVGAIGRVPEINPQACAELARDRFGGRAMVDGYVDVYERAIGGESFPERATVRATLRSASIVHDDHAQRSVGLDFHTLAVDPHLHAHPTVQQVNGEPLPLDG
jgi:glycosyltransferase involved in cell wall biosynthesis